MCGISCEPAELIRLYAALVLTAFAVRWLDDVVDENPRRVVGLGSYSMLALALAAACQPAVTGSMVAACYAVGMLGDGRRLLPSGLPPAVESGLSLLAAGLLVGWEPVLAAACTILAVQIADDLRDMGEDQQVKAANLALLWGTVEAGLLAAASLVVAARLAPWIPVLAMAAIPPAESLYRWLADARRPFLASWPETAGEWPETSESSLEAPRDARTPLPPGPGQADSTSPDVPPPGRPGR